jgi:hypothetical protein
VVVVVVVVVVVGVVVVVVVVVVVLHFGVTVTVSVRVVPGTLAVVYRPTISIVLLIHETSGSELLMGSQCWTTHLDRLGFDKSCASLFDDRTAETSDLGLDDFNRAFRS